MNECAVKLSFYTLFTSIYFLLFSWRVPAHSQAYSGPIMNSTMSTQAEPNTDYAFEAGLATYNIFIINFYKACFLLKMQVPYPTSYLLFLRINKCAALSL